MVSSALVIALFAVGLVTCNYVDDWMKTMPYNGREIDADEFKFLAEISVEYSTSMTYTCSGSILDANWIITAAHCVSFPGQITQARVTRLKSTPALPALSIGSIKKHPKFIPDPYGATVPLTSVRFDLALLRTTQPIQFNQLVQPIPLGRSSPVGSGVTAVYRQPVNQPRKEQISVSHCNMRMIFDCVRLGDMPTIGHGETGGPVVANGVLVGVLSSVARLKVAYAHHIADVNSNYDWIQSVISMH